MFLVNSRQRLVLATHKGYLFSRSYEAILPSSLERVISRPLVYSTYPPVSVMVQALYIFDIASFSWKYDIDYFNAVAFRLHASIFQNVFSVFISDA